jgi:predicted GNAT family acetyltransferase
MAKGGRVPGPSAFVVVDNADRHQFEIDLGGGELAIAQYVLRGGRIVFTHTEVPQSHEGQGLGSVLVRAALASARERKLKVVPLCPFVAAYIKDHPEEQDLLDDPSRRKLGLP